MTEAERGASSALLVEDDALLAQALAARIAGLGLEPKIAATRSAALACASGCLIAIVDLGLPPVPQRPDEGLALIDALRLICPTLPVIVLTGQDEAASARQAIARGAFDFLCKPVAGTAFDQAVARARRYACVGQELAASGLAAVHISAHEAAGGMRETADAVQEKLLRQVLQACAGNVTEAARRLGLERTRLYYYLDKFGIKRSHDSHF